jgi:hypothetical protein
VSDSDYVAGMVGDGKPMLDGAMTLSPLPDRLKLKRRYSIGKSQDELSILTSKLSPV